MVRLFVSCSAVALVAVSLSAQAPATPDALARALQQHYQRVRDFKADFTQTSRTVLRTQSRGEGTVSVKKPGKMRWEYTKPEKQLIVSDGVTLYSYIPDDKSVMKSGVSQDDQATTSVMFLAGKGDITRDFTASAAQSPVAGAVALKLTPRRPEPEFEYLVLAVDPGSLELRALTTRDEQGGESTIVFRNLKENTQIPDKTFIFTPPRGVEVTTVGNGG